MLRNLIRIHVQLFSPCFFLRLSEVLLWNVLKREFGHKLNAHNLEFLKLAYLELFLTFKSLAKILHIQLTIGL